MEKIEESRYHVPGATKAEVLTSAAAPVPIRRTEPTRITVARTATLDPKAPMFGTLRITAR